MSSTKQLRGELRTGNAFSHSHGCSVKASAYSMSEEIDRAVLRKYEVQQKLGKGVSDTARQREVTRDVTPSKPG